jgi:Histidine kinase-, DNA gyrase B-, and HSP90-like ATPase
MAMTEAVDGSNISRKYRMRLSLNVLDHLGLNLYSNIPAVLSEVVANAWDADAESVQVEIDAVNKRIVVTDDGTGMDDNDLNDRFLHVGYRRREGLSPITAKGRHVMGRKGIGKLSLFAIADTIRLETVKGAQRAGFTLSTAAIRSQMAIAEGEYNPVPLDDIDRSMPNGTRMTLTDLRVKPTAGTMTAIRRRLARRFSIIGPDHGFRVLVNGAEIQVAERDYYANIEYLWSIGGVGDTYEKLCTKASKTTRVPGLVNVGEGWSVTGWVGTVDEQRHINEEMNVVPVLAWGKLIHEDLLSAVKPAGVFAKYVIGELHADFVDQDGLDDIATSDRQSLKENDPRFEALQAFLADVLRIVGNSWRDLRKEDALDKARKNPVVEEWYSSLKGDAKKYAKQLFGKIGDIPIATEADRIELYKNGILAFEKLRLRDLLSEIDKLDGPLALDMVARAFAGIDEIEAAMYGEIAKGRIAVINSFKGLVDGDEREKVLQQHLFEHIWLIDPSWERAATNVLIEERVTKEFEKITAKLSDDEKKARWDIKYRTAAGKHVIIEMKKYSVTVTTGQIFDQLGKYRNALVKCLEENFPDESRAIECIAVLGRPPHNVAPDEVDSALRTINARVKTYDDLINGALKSYGEYLEKHAQVGKLADLISRLENTVQSDGG